VGVTGLAAPARAAAPPTEVNTCGQVFSGSGFLSGDLDCSGFVGTAITIQGGTLNLQGFTLTAPSVSDAPVIACAKSCKIVSDAVGATITASGSGVTSVISGLAGPNGPKINIRISNVVINDVAVATGPGNVKILDSTVMGITDSSHFGALDADRVTLVRSVVTGNSVPGIFGRAKLIDSEVSNNTGVGVDGTAVLKRSMIFGNSEDGIGLTNRVRVTDSSITGNGRRGMDLFVSGKAKILRSDISGNATQGIGGQAKRVVVRESTITNNGAQGIFQNSGTVTNPSVV